MNKTINVVTAPGRCEVIYCKETSDILEQMWKDENLSTSRTEEVPFHCAEVIELSFRPWTFKARVQVSENDSLVCTGEIKYNGSEFKLINLQTATVHELRGNSKKFLSELLYNKLFEQYLPEMHTQYLSENE